MDRPANTIDKFELCHPFELLFLRDAADLFHVLHTDNYIKLPEIVKKNIAILKKYSRELFQLLAILTGDVIASVFRTVGLYGPHICSRLSIKHDFTEPTLSCSGYFILNRSRTCIEGLRKSVV